MKYRVVIQMVKDLAPIKFDLEMKGSYELIDKVKGLGIGYSEVHEYPKIISFRREKS